MANGRILYAFYGDDFTGSTDVLQQLASNGVESVLFLQPPGAEQLARFPGVRAIGIAGDSRSRTPEWMREHLGRAFEQLKSLGAAVNHYKVCSTFDSSPERGSIGCAIEVGLRTFAETPFVPVVVAAPHLRRYVCFGHLFAAGPDGEVVRIDRHAMRHHPVTPMREADLRRHLKAQMSTAETARIGLVDLTQWAESDRAPALPGERVVVFDGTDTAMNARVGEMLWRQAQRQPLFSASSSGFTSALVEAWRAEGTIGREAPLRTVPAEVAPLLVISGSCSAMTAQQIRWALANGFTGIAAEPQGLTEASGDAARERLVTEAAEALSTGRSAVLYTSVGGGQAEGGFGAALGAALGTALGRVLAALVERHGVRRVLLCGGDTCSHAVQQLDLYALTWAADLCPGGPLCRAHSMDARLDGLELVLKGGQVGGEDFFGRVLAAHRGP